MRRGYGQYCPLALAVEFLCERWTLLIVSRLLDGCTQFNAIHRGVPRISPSLLARRLQELERGGVVVRATASRGKASEYRLTQAGRELEPIVEQLAVWGQQWGRDMRNDDLDPAFLVWSMHLQLDATRMPPGRTVLEFEFARVPSNPRRFWLVTENGVIDMCFTDPGYDVDLKVTSDIRVFIEAWRGIRDLRTEIRAGRIRVVGHSQLRRQLPEWLKLSSLASYPRRRLGAERRRFESRESPATTRPC
ncbi:MAG TPA: helix-turn-helix domain-containing protein [Steroidobacteraceae bacterium]|nr:helix-turn-helix domain-containing protein [Steroidobacteraceae bacterium]